MSDFQTKVDDLAEALAPCAHRWSRSVTPNTNPPTLRGGWLNLGVPAPHELRCVDCGDVVMQRPPSVAVVSVDWIVGRLRLCFDLDEGREDDDAILARMDELVSELESMQEGK